MTMGAAIKRVGFVGIGNMGWPMAANLVKAGFEVAVCDAVPGRSAQFASEMTQCCAAGFRPCPGRKARSSPCTPSLSGRRSGGAAGWTIRRALPQW